MRFNITAALGPQRELTNQGFLLCKDVPIARTGQQVYGPGQTPIDVGADGTVIIDREASEVFRAETVASGNGATFVVWFHTGKLSHPVSQEGATEFVVPDNWKEYAAGFVFNVHRGTGKDSDLLLADILVTDAEAIRLITEEGFTEVSAGYDAKYEEDSPGRGRQTDILINHVALVEAGRAGPRCAVQDSASGGKMATIKVKGWDKVKHGIAAKLRTAFPTIDEAKLQEAVDSVEDEPETEAEKAAKAADAKKVADEAAAKEDGETHIHIHNDEPEGKTVDSDDFEALKKDHEDLKEKHAGLEARVADCEARLPAVKTADEKAAEEDEKKVADAKRVKDEAEKKEEEEKKAVDEDLKEEAPEGTGDEDLEKVVKATDSAYMEDSFQAMRSNAEILAPGITFPAFDSTAAPKATLATLTAFRKKVIGIAASTVDSAATIAELRAGRPLTTEILERMTPKETRQLFAGAAVAAKARNAGRVAAGAAHVADAADKTVASADLNKRNADFWATH